MSAPAALALPRPRVHEFRRARDLGRGVFFTALALLVVVDLLLTWVHPDADAPRGYSRDHSLSVDGYWYLAEARALARGTVAEVGADYRQPLLTLPAALFFRVFGVSHASARAVNSLASILILALLAAGLARAHGRAAALVGVGLLALSPAWHAFLRAPILYPWLAFWMLLAATVASRPGIAPVIGATALVCGLAVGLKSLAIVLLPALFFEASRRLGLLARARAWLADRRVRWVFCASLLGAGGLGYVLFGPSARPEFWQRIALYFAGIDGPALGLTERVLGFEARVGLIAAFPFLALGSLATALLSLFRVWPAGPRGRSLLRIALITQAATLTPLVFSAYAPLRYLLVLAPLAAWTTASGFAALTAEGRGRRLVQSRPARILTVAVSGLVLVWASLQVFAAFGNELLPASPWVVAASLLALLALTGSRRYLTPGLALALVLVPLGIGAAPRLGAFLQPANSLRLAERELDLVLPREAVILGTFAHALSWEGERRAVQLKHLEFGGGKLGRAVARSDWTHLLVDRPADPASFVELFAHEGAPLEYLASFWVRGAEVQLYRFRDAALAGSELARVRRAMRAADYAGARELLERWLEKESRSALAWALLGHCALRLSQGQEAWVALSRAVELGPYRVDAHLDLARLYEANRDAVAARQHLRAALGSEAENVVLRRDIAEWLARLGPANRER